eukprot:TRINITY_DN63900_c0_g1_i1.p1 TRINITY_DN63900_c0_g1~~TRINITY_DN63900_c0_g1_i1.p1  ORF type:complete len:316 (+),score=32.69 TRINITY_DN63900_c0_g1_i1:72-1019(+)
MPGARVCGGVAIALPLAAVGPRSRPQTARRAAASSNGSGRGNQVRSTESEAEADSADTSSRRGSVDGSPPSARRKPAAKKKQKPIVKTTRPQPFSFSTDRKSKRRSRTDVNDEDQASPRGTRNAASSSVEGARRGSVFAPTSVLAAPTMSVPVHRHCRTAPALPIAAPSSSGVGGIGGHIARCTTWRQPTQNSRDRLRDGDDVRRGETAFHRQFSSRDDDDHIVRSSTINRHGAVITTGSSAQSEVHEERRVCFADGGNVEVHEYSVDQERFSVPPTTRPPRRIFGGELQANMPIPKGNARLCVRDALQLPEAAL